TDDAALCAPKIFIAPWHLSSMAAVCLTAVCLYFAQSPGRTVFFLDEATNLVWAKDELHSTAAWRADCQSFSDPNAFPVTACSHVGKQYCQLSLHRQCRLKSRAIKSVPVSVTEQKFRGKIVSMPRCPYGRGDSPSPRMKYAAAVRAGPQKEPGPFLERWSERPRSLSIWC